MAAHHRVGHTFRQGSLLLYWLRRLVAGQAREWFTRPEQRTTILVQPQCPETCRRPVQPERRQRVKDLQQPRLAHRRHKQPFLCHPHPRPEVDVLTHSEGSISPHRHPTLPYDFTTLDLFKKTLDLF